MSKIKSVHFFTVFIVALIWTLIVIGFSTSLAVFVKVVVTVFALKLLVVWQSLSLGLTSLVQPAHNS